MSEGKPATITLRVGAHAFKVRVDPEMQDRMLEAAAIVDREYTHMCKRERVADGERAAIMVALKLASEQPEGVADSEALDIVLEECLELAAGRTGN